MKNNFQTGESPQIDSRMSLRQRDRILWWAAPTAILLGIVARLWQYTANPSIWVDEAAIARNVLDRQPLQLFLPLDYAQMAPPGFLLSIKLSAAVLGFSEYALRLTPITTGVVSVILFFFAARAVLQPVASIVAVFMFSIAIPLVFFSSNLKQYSSDVAMTLIIILIAFRLHRSTLSHRGVFGFALAAIPLLFFSQAAVFPLTAAGVAIFIDAVVLQRSDKWYRFIVIASWAAAAAAVIAYSSVSITPVDNTYLHRFWASAFMPKYGWGMWLWTTTQNIFAGSPQSSAFDGSLHYTWPGMFVTLFVIGSIALCVKSPMSGSLVVGPVILTLLASGVHMYPFGTRVSLFLLPLLLLTIAAGADYLGQLFIRRRIGEYTPVLLLPFAIATFLQQPPPYTPQHLRPVIQYVSDRWESGDALWVYYGAGQAFEYYKKIIPISGDIRIGNCDRADPREYLHQVDVERGRARVWILMAHGSGAFGFDERQLIIEYLKTIGLQIEEFHAPLDDNTSNRAAVFLFDLSAPEKLTASSAKQFPIQNNHLPQTWTCYGTMSPLVANERIISEVMRRDSP